jgi:periplasmic divalent cation tolerance protein
MSGALVEIVTTVATEEDARKLAREIVGSGLVACATFFAVRSVFPWKGALCDESEFQVVCKTSAARAPEAERLIRRQHPYETPAILRVPIFAVNEEYADWVEDSARGSGE